MRDRVRRPGHNQNRMCGNRIVSDTEHPTPEPEPGPDATPESISVDDPATLTQRLQQAEQEREEYLNLLRAKQAEFENYQKRASRDRDQERRYAAAPLATELLPALDNLERALQAAKEAGDSGPVVQGVQATYTQILDALKRFGIVPMEARGQAFDPNLHEAVAQMPSADAEPQTILEVYRQGYQIHERVLRPASVVIAAPPADAGE